MIDFLLGAMSVLVARGNRLIGHLENKKGLPKPIMVHCAQVADKTRAIIHSVNKRLAVLQSLQLEVGAGRLLLDQAAPILRGSFQSYRDSRRELDAFEEFFVGHINRFIDADIFLTRVAEEIWKEVGLPGVSPVAVTSTSGYFCTVAPLGIVFCPPSSEDHLLIMPDFYHESGHIIPERIGRPLHGVRFKQALRDHANNLRNQIRRISRPLDPKVISEIIAKWEWRWAEEVACDTLAARLVGPAYGWCNLHLCLNSPNVYAIGLEHPADAARTKHIFRVLKRCGWSTEVSEMAARWDQYLQTVKQKKPRHYDDYHPGNLFDAAMEDVEEATQDLTVFNSQPGSLSTLLNVAWRQFLSDPVGYNSWEQQTVSEFRQKLIP